MNMLRYSSPDLQQGRGKPHFSQLNPGLGTKSPLDRINEEHPNHESESDSMTESETELHFREKDNIVEVPISS